MTSFEQLDAEMQRLKEISGGGSSLEPVLQFAAERASAFQSACPDGSQPLIWTQYHNEYREMFECHLQNVLQSLNMTEDSFHELCGYIQDLIEIVENLGDDSENLYGYIKAITSSEDYDAFLQLMFTEVQRQHLVPMEGQVQEIDVVVPEGMGPGQLSPQISLLLPVDYLGRRYELYIPVGRAQTGVPRTSNRSWCLVVLV
ncbi:ARL2_Bind_BART domain-containing protein [Durusdinium trenchii]|uniref:ARL2_Bind_BART domain-containing protein n=1 Tax=Durusdinium trenchii TaxID=1381693 RepID=A0ABP0Q2A7_9DINO